MRFPGFTADTSLYSTSQGYQMLGGDTASPVLITPQWCLPAGLCGKALHSCRSGEERPWCDILNRCVACYDV